MLAAERGGVRRPSSWSVAEERTKVRLPTKAGSGLVAASVPLSKPVKPTIVQTDKKAKAALKRRWQEVAPAADIDSEDDDGDGSNEEVAVEAKAREKPRLSIATMPLPELLRRREDIKIELTDHAEKILEAPEKALIGSGGRPLKAMHTFTCDPDYVVQKLAMVALTRVLVDILPSYRIRLPTEKELAMPVTKDVRKLREFEAAQLGAYKRFLQVLESAVTCMDGSRVPVGTGEKDKRGPTFRDRETSVTPQADAEARVSVASTAVKCQCELLRALPHFNHREELIDAVVGKAAHKLEALSVPAVTALSELFSSDVDASATALATASISRLVRSRGSGVRPALISCLSSIPVSTATSGHLKKHKRKKGASGGIEEGLEDELEDAAARESRHAQAMKDALAVYFRLLRAKGNAKVLPTVLAGIAKFAHLIDVGVALDIISALRDMVSNPGLPLSSGLSCVLAVYRILSGPGKLLNVDDSAFSTYLLSCIPRLALPRGELFTLQVLDAVDALLLRRQEFSIEKVISFASALVCSSLHVPPHASLALLSALRALLTKYPLSQLLEPESERAVSWSSVSLWGLSPLINSFHPSLRPFAKDAASGIPLRPGDSYREVFKAFDGSLGEFRPPIQEPRTKRK